MAKAPRQIPLGEVATTRDGRDITQPWVNQLKEPRDRRLLGAVDWGAYEVIRKDDQVKSCMQQRIGAVVSAEWDVTPGDETDPRSVEAADVLKDQIARLGIDRWSEKKLWGVFYGYAVTEAIWSIEDGKIRMKHLKVRHARRFRYDQDDNLRLLTRANMAPGELLPPKKFMVVKWGATNDDEPYGEGLADWLYWPCLFKRNGIRFWNIFLDKYAAPTAKATYRRGTPPADIKKVLQILQSMSTDSGFAVPEGLAVEFMEASRSGIDSYEKLARYMDEAIAKIILSQTMTTQNGSSLSQAQVHAGVKLEVVKSDADMLSDAFNGDEGFARWWTDWNYGPDVAAPKFARMVEEEADLKTQAETDNALAQQGWVRTDESFQDTYGDGYVRKPDATTVPVDPAKADNPKAKIDNPIGQNDNRTGSGGNPDPNAADPNAAEVASFMATDPRPLYVYRRLKNAKDIIAWAKAQGFKSMVPARELHVTVAYSKRPVNWFAIGTDWSAELTVPEGGPRAVDRLGAEGAVVLHFTSYDLKWRNEEMRDKGASWDFEDYLPHVTLTYDPGEIDLTKVEPYQGKLVFGPEVFEMIEDGWADELTEISFAEVAAPKLDIVDQAVAALMETYGWAPLSPGLERIITAIEQAQSSQELDQALLETLDPKDREAATQALARAGFAIRTAAEAGVDQ